MVKLRDKYGTVTDFDQRYAKILLKLGKHKLVKEPVSPPAPAVPAAAMAEAPLPVPAAAEPIAAHSTETKPEIIRPRRTYRRRDMRAED